MLALPAVLGVLGVFVGRKVALMRGACPHRGKVWGAFLLPLLALPLMMDVVPLVLMVVLGAALGAGLTAHAALRVTALSTTVGVTLATVGGYFADFR